MLRLESSCGFVLALVILLGSLPGCGQQQQKPTSIAIGTVMESVHDFKLEGAVGFFPLERAPGSVIAVVIEKEARIERIKEVAAGVPVPSGPRVSAGIADLRKGERVVVYGERVEVETIDAHGSPTVGERLHARSIVILEK